MSGSYDEWNELLAAAYYNEDHAGRPAYLSVDDDDLNAIASCRDWGPGADSLSEAVIDKRGRHRSLYRFAREAREWRRCGASGTPPYVALLALCVLAGSRMASDPEAGIVGHAYYARLNPLLRLPTHAGQPQGFDALGTVWEDLNRWLAEDNQGLLGLPTARTRPHPRHIWWPISQCLLRAADRHRLPDFFRSVRLEPRTDIVEPQLWELLCNWTRPGCGLTQQGIGTIDRATGDIAAQLASLVKRELDSWDGQLRDAQGRRRGEVLLLAEKLAGGRRVTLRFVARRPQGFPVDGWRTVSGEPFGLEAAGTDWFRPLPMAPGPRLMREGFTLTSGKFALSYEASLAIPFRATFEPVSGWLSARQSTAVEEHLVLAHASVADELRAFLRRHAQGHLELRRPAGDIPEGWLIALSVRISSAVLNAPPEFARLAPRLNTATRLEGGLQIANGQYLVGGEPDLWITVGAGESCDVTIDGRTERFRPGVVPLRLSELGLPAGRHVIVAGGITRNVTTSPGFPVVAAMGTGRLGHEFARHRGYRPRTEIAGALPPGPPPSGTVRLSGAKVEGGPDDLPIGPLPPILLRTGLSWLLLGARPGEILEVPSPDRPEWLSDLGLEAQFFDCPAPFPIEWSVQQGQLGGTKVRAMREPPSPPLRDQAIGAAPALAWARTVADAEGAHEEGAASTETWNEYVDVARAILFEYEME